MPGTERRQRAEAHRRPARGEHEGRPIEERLGTVPVELLGSDRAELPEDEEETQVREDDETSPE